MRESLADVAIPGAKSGGGACEGVGTHVMWGPDARWRVGRYSSTRWDTWPGKMDSAGWSPRAIGLIAASGVVSRKHVGATRHVTLLPPGTKPTAFVLVGRIGFRHVAT